MAKKKIYSIENLVDLSGGDDAFISEMIHMFISHSDAFIGDINNALSAKDIVTLKSKTHKYKTSAQLFQILELHSLLIKLENFNDFSQIKEILKNIKEISAEAVKQLKEELKKH